MTNLAPLLQAFFLDRLLRERQASPHTVSAYRDAFRILLAFVQNRSGKAPSQLLLSDLGQPTVGAFLDYLECERGNTVRLWHVGESDEIVERHFNPRLPYEQEKVACQQVQTGLRVVLSELKRHYHDERSTEEVN